MGKVYIVSAKRTAVGSFLGTLSNLKASEFGGEVIQAILEETKIPAAEVDEVIVGNILSAGHGQGLGRQIALKGGCPETVCAHTINMLCGSGMKAVMNATLAIEAGYSDVVIAGGVESMSGAPYLLPNTARSGTKMGDFKVTDHMIYDALTDGMYGIHMGVTAENIAEKYNITREEQDAFAIKSQEKAIQAIDNKKFADEIVPVTVKTRKESFVFDTDEYPNRKTSLEKLGTLRPAFIKDGTVTAGNASGINDGASFVMVVSEAALDKYNLKPLAEIVGIGQGGVDPRVMGLGPTPAIRVALKRAELELKDMDLLELNEAFAAQALGVVHEICEEHGVSKEELMEKNKCKWWSHCIRTSCWCKR